MRTTTAKLVGFGVWGIFGGLWLAPAQAQVELLLNGGFEFGDFGGWTAFSQVAPEATAAGLFVDDDTVVPGDPNGFPDDSPLSPVTFQPTAGPRSGRFYAVTDGDGAANNSLLQSFAVPDDAVQVTLSFSLFVNARDGAGAFNTGGLLDYSQAALTQFARVDLLTGSATPFSLGPGNVIQNFYLGVDPNIGPNPLYPIPYTTYTFDITGLVMPGDAYQIRFADVGNRFVLNTGIDDVSIRAFNVAQAPEPGTLALIGFGVVATASKLRRRRR